MLAHVVEDLRCPHCGGDLALHGRTVRCTAGHTFDVARQGYVSLLAGDAGAGTGDSADMVTAREAFIGHYEGLMALVADAAAAVVGTGGGASGGPGCVVDVGAGTGRYLARALDVLPDRAGIALDLSKPALRRAARAHPRIGAVACDVWRGLPVRDGVAAAVLSVFAPRNAEEIVRVLRPGGVLVVAAPTGRHLGELVGPLGLVSVDERKRERLDAALGPHLATTGEQVWERTLVLDHGTVADLVAMGPSARHVDPPTVRTRLAALPDPVPVTASVTVSTHQGIGAAPSSTGGTDGQRGPRPPR